MVLRPPVNVMPAFYYPTTVAVVDDNKKHLNSLALMLLSLNIASKCFFDPAKGLDFINKSSFAERFIQEMQNTKTKENIGLLIQNIQNLVYNPNRFDEINTAIIDYAIPMMNGLTLCKQIVRTLRTILLTGEADYALAKSAFDQDLISQFIRKDEDDIEQTLLKHISANQYKAFEILSFAVMSQLTADENVLHSLFDPSAITLITSLMKEKNVCEYYLHDRYGSYLMLDNHANLSWLLFRSEDDMENSVKLAMKLTAPSEIIDAIKSRKVLLSITDEKEPAEILHFDWNKLVHPAIHSVANKNYYHTFVDALPYHSVKKEKILSYNDFLHKRKA